LKVVAFNANGIGRQAHELRKQMQDLKIDVALFSETHLKPHIRFYIPNYHILHVYRNDRQDRHKDGTAVSVKKGIPHTYADLPPLLSVEATRVCIPIGHNEMLFASIYTSPLGAMKDADITSSQTLERSPFWQVI
jgi:exonuclease III